MWNNSFHKWLFLWVGIGWSLWNIHWTFLVITWVLVWSLINNWHLFLKKKKKKNENLFFAFEMRQPTPGTKDLDWTYIRCSDDVLNVFRTFYVCSIYVLCLGRSAVISYSSNASAQWQSIVFLQYLIILLIN